MVEAVITIVQPPGNTPSARDARYSYTCPAPDGGRYYARVRARHGSAWGAFGNASSHVNVRDVVSITAASSSITEGEDAVFTVKLHSAPSGDTDVTYNITVSGEYGVSAADNQTVTVGTGGTGTITLSTTDDNVDERDVQGITVQPGPPRAVAGYSQRSNGNQVRLSPSRTTNDASAEPTPTPDIGDRPGLDRHSRRRPRRLRHRGHQRRAATVRPEPAASPSNRTGTGNHDIYVMNAGTTVVSAATNQTVTVGDHRHRDHRPWAPPGGRVDEANGSITFESGPERGL